MSARITLASALIDIVAESYALENETYKDYFVSRNKMWRRAAWIYEHGIDVRVERANNEKKKYTEEEIGLPIVPMRTKAETGDRQTADYVLFWKFKFEQEIEGEPSPYRKMGICFERKEVKDFHGTIIANYDRFDREMDRFLRDKKTKLMIVLIEGTLAETIAFLPPMRYGGNQVKGMMAAKLGAIASIGARGVHVHFAGTRESSANSIKRYVEHFFEKNIEFILREEIKEIRTNGVKGFSRSNDDIPASNPKNRKPAGVSAKRPHTSKSVRTCRKRSTSTKT